MLAGAWMLGNTLNTNIVCTRQLEQSITWVTLPGCKSFMAAQDTLVGIELMHMIKKWPLVVEEGKENLTAAELFYSLTA
jgi:hypothetical protein